MNFIFHVVFASMAVYCETTTLFPPYTLTLETPFNSITELKNQTSNLLQTLTQLYVDAVSTWLNTVAPHSIMTNESLYEEDEADEIFYASEFTLSVDDARDYEIPLDNVDRIRQGIAENVDWYKPTLEYLDDICERIFVSSGKQNDMFLLLGSNCTFHPSKEDFPLLVFPIKTICITTKELGCNTSIKFNHSLNQRNDAIYPKWLLTLLFLVTFLIAN
ncbi:hypothetical protein ACOME3_007442 [Neoechinorhynchus agilis]